VYNISTKLIDHSSERKKKETNRPIRALTAISSLMSGTKHPFRAKIKA
jgi:hypothetical protein